MSLFKKKRDVAKVIKENPVLAKTLSINPALAKSFQNNLQLSKSFQAVQKDEQVIHKIKSFEKTPAASKLKDSLGKNPRGLTEKFVTKLGAAFHAAFYKSNGVVASVNLGIAFAIGLVLLVTVVGAATLLVG
ncbi:Hypothetical protein PHPALM_20663 [Phytophthora palmivora]|uniref:Uncharacterized protein n=1 Tax=Phytophthora palmivora TaxID=4796 RepID=A0A2P4XEA7_9STRA|nr:Hypothetical protein PHPALM_20663 [Phytophthora palmivora]